MKKIIYFFLILLLIGNFILFIPNDSYAICNTVRFNKEVAAVQLTLANGQVINDIRISKTAATTAQPSLVSNNFKKLNLIFAVQTEDSLDEKKSALKEFVDKIYDMYGSSSSKIQMGIIPFKDIDTSGSMDDTSVLKADQTEIKNEIDSLDDSKDNSLEQALYTAKSNFETYGASGVSNDSVVQCMILMTEGVSTEDRATKSNVILKDISNNMVAIYAMFIGVDAGSDSNIQKLIKNAFEVQVADNLDPSNNNLNSQLDNDAYYYINQSAINESTIIPQNNDKNSLITSDRIILTADNQIVQGATLKIEYVMSTSRVANYGSGQIYNMSIQDLVDPDLFYSPSDTLITDTSKTNQDYSWTLSTGTDGGTVLKTSSQANEVRLVLSRIIAPGNDDIIYSNTAQCSISFDVGASTPASYTRTSTAMDVQILPPFGEENIWEDERVIIAILSIGIFVIGFLIRNKLNKR